MHEPSAEPAWHILDLLPITARPETARIAGPRLGTYEHPLGAPRPGARFLQGLRCACGSTMIAYASVFDSDEPLDCPACNSSLR